MIIYSDPTYPTSYMIINRLLINKYDEQDLFITVFVGGATTHTQYIQYSKLQSNICLYTYILNI
jgi:hypothetical protein